MPAAASAGKQSPEKQHGRTWQDLDHEYQALLAKPRWIAAGEPDAEEMKQIQECRETLRAR